MIELYIIYIINCGCVAVLCMCIAQQGGLSNAPADRIVFITAIYLLFSPVTFVITCIFVVIMVGALICDSIKRLFT